MACRSPATTALVETAVVDQRLVNVDGVDAERRGPRGVGELDPDLRVRSGRRHAGRDIGPPVLARERPKGHRGLLAPGLAQQPQCHRPPRP